MTIVGQHSACVAEVSIQRKDDCQNKLKFLVFLFGMEIIALTQNCAYILQSRPYQGKQEEPGS